MGGASLSLAPLREALVGEARQRAEECLLQANREARTVVERAEADARALLEQARTQGEAAAELEAARERAHTQREARALLLGARRGLRDELERRALAAAEEFRQEPGYRTLLEALARKARTQLGEDAVVEIDPPAGGVIAQAGSRYVDYSLPVLVAWCLARTDPNLGQVQP